MPVTFELPRTQHAISNPEEWNAKWELLFAHDLLDPKMLIANNIQQVRDRRATVNS
ncbi:hypothetical protein V5O48_019158, partial [Marasmius crinis-equi]